jgi:hypothetical protein
MTDKVIDYHLNNVGLYIMYYDFVKKTFWLIVTGLIIVVGVSGCGKKEPPYKSSSFPDWSYDKPFYFVPADSALPISDFKIDPKPTYTRNTLLSIPKPNISDNRKAPRTAIWVTKTDGMTWEKVGYFGLQQTHFVYHTDGDGYYGFRFIGPGIPPADTKPPKPHQTWIVDTEAPVIKVYVYPDQETYLPGDMITIEWSCEDENLDPETVKIAVCLDGQPSKTIVWKALSSHHQEYGTLDVEIPDEAVDKKLIVRVMARDLAGNGGIGYSVQLPVIFEPPPPPTTQSTEGKVSLTPAAGNGQSTDTQPITTLPHDYPGLE